MAGMLHEPKNGLMVDGMLYLAFNLGSLEHVCVIAVLFIRAMNINT